MFSWISHTTRFLLNLNFCFTELRFMHFCAASLDTKSAACSFHSYKCFKKLISLCQICFDKHKDNFIIDFEKR